MATTNTNTDLSLLTTDIFEISEFLDNIREEHISDLDETNSMVGIFGYMNEMFSQTLQNTLIVVSETSNEAIPTRAKFSKNVIKHAMNYGITDINAKPAVITLMLFLPIEHIERNFTEYDSQSRGTFILDRNIPINVDSFEFHLDYDIIIKRFLNNNNNYVWTAMYDLFESGTTKVKQYNTISDISNPYITTLVTTNINNVPCIGFSVRVHQVSLQKVNQTILTSNSIENKTVTFDFEDQLATFDVDVTEDNVTTHLTPIYSGLLDYTVEDGEWCYYEYLSANTIRIIFSRDSFVPKLNAQVVVNIQRSEGANGNFTYTNTFRTSLKSTRFNDYNGMYMTVTPLMGGMSVTGKNAKSITDLRRIIPREASSRGAVINTTDLNNFFNSINDDECKLIFKKRRDNPFERMYFAYIVMRKQGYVYPTNTLNLKIAQSDFKGFAGNNNLSIVPGTKFYYYNHGSDSDNAYATVTQPVYVEGLDPDDYPYPMTINADGDMVRVFEYMSPFMITIDDDLITSYLMTIMNENKTFKFDSINTYSDLQFIATNMNWRRKYIYYDEDNNKQFYDYNYYMDVDIAQNNTSDYGLIQYHRDDANELVIDDIRIRVIMLLYVDDTDVNPYRYVEAELVDYQPAATVYTFRFKLPTDDLMDLNNRINITGIKNAKPENFQHMTQIETSHGYMNKNTYAKIFIMADFGPKAGDKKLNSNNIYYTEEEANEIYEAGTFIYGEESNPGNRAELQSLIPVRDDIINAFLNNDIYLDREDGTQANVVTIMKANSDYMKEVTDYNGNEQQTETMILRYLRNNKNSDFVQNVLLQDEDVIEVINSYSFENFDRYTVCNTLVVDGGLDFYHDYSNIMRSVVTVKQVPKLDENGNPLFIEITRTDSLGRDYIEYKPVYMVNDAGTYYYNYTVKRIPMIKDGYFDTEELMQSYVFDLDERRRYFNECLYVLEDTFDIDLKFYNTYGPSRMFYYNIPASTQYRVRAIIKQLKVLNNTTDEDDENAIINFFNFGDQIDVIKTKGQWGLVNTTLKGWVDLTYIESLHPGCECGCGDVGTATQRIPVIANPTNPTGIIGYLDKDETATIIDKDANWGSINKTVQGWIKLGDTTRVVNYIDNVALNMKFQLEAQTSADKYIDTNIISDIKEYIEDINYINELHVPNIITLITNNYREQLIYFEFLDVNGYGPACQHLYLDEQVDAEICPEFLNIETKQEGTYIPAIDITVY